MRAADASRVFVGIPNARSVIIGGEWRATLVAPNADVIADMYDKAKLVGSFFSYQFTLHQGRWLERVRFPSTSPWVPVCRGTDGYTICS